MQPMPFVNKHSEVDKPSAIKMKHLLQFATIYWANSEMLSMDNGHIMNWRVLELNRACFFD